MVIKVALAPHEVQNILLQHLQEKFKGHAGKGEIIEVRRVGEAPPVFEATVEAVRPTPNAWD